MAIRNVVTRGYGAGATIGFVVTRGYSIGAAPVSTGPAERMHADFQKQELHTAFEGRALQTEFERRSMVVKH